MKRYFKDLWSVFIADGIDLDKTEEAILGGPKGETISLWSALENRHGWFLAHVACLFFSLCIQFNHCEDTIIGKPMKAGNYIRALICLVVVPLLLIYVIYFVLFHLGAVIF